MASAASALSRTVSPGSISMPASSSGKLAGGSVTSPVGTELGGEAVRSLANDSMSDRCSLLNGRARLTCPHLARNRRQLKAIQVAKLAPVNDTSKYTDRKRTSHVDGPGGCRRKKPLGAAPRCKRLKNVTTGMPAVDKQDRNAVVSLQTELREEMERKSAFCVPGKHKNNTPPRLETQRTAFSCLPVPSRRRMARERESGSPTRVALTTVFPLPTRVVDGSPQARRKQEERASNASLLTA